MSEQPVQVILVEDDDALRAAARQTFVLADIPVTDFPRAEPALVSLTTGAPVVVVTDVRLPGASGFDVLQHVRERWPKIPVILITAHGDVPGAVAAIKQGAFDYVIKPVDADAFEVTVRRALEHGRLLRENPEYKTRSARWRAKQRADDKARAERMRVLDSKTELHKLKGDVWWEVRVGRAGDGREPDVVALAQLSDLPLDQLYSRPGLRAIAKRQLNKADKKKYGLL